MENAILEFLRLYAPAITAVIMTVVIPILTRVITIKIQTRTMMKIEARNEAINSKIDKLLDSASLADVRKDIQEIRDDLSRMQGRPPKSGRQR